MWTTQEKELESAFIQNEMNSTDLREASRKTLEDQFTTLDKDRFRYVTTNPKNNLKRVHKKIQASTDWMTQQSDVGNMHTREQVIRLIQSFMLPVVIDLDV